MPNPVGNDKESEYIKLLNNGNSGVNLSGWIIKDASGKTFRLSGSLDAGQELALPYSQTKIALNNNGEQVSLYDVSGNLVDELDYSGQAAEGQIISKIINQESRMMEIREGQISNTVNSFLISDSSFLIQGALAAAILSGLGLYIILQLERKLDIKLF